MNNQTELIFVYNANSSVFSQVTDYIHKILSPQTYECNLCKLTFDNLCMKKEWKNFIERFPLKSNFFHKDEFLDQYPTLSNVQLPAVFKMQDGLITQLITSEEINKQRTIPDLESLVQTKVK